MEGRKSHLFSKLINNHLKRHVQHYTNIQLSEDSTHLVLAFFPSSETTSQFTSISSSAFRVFKLKIKFSSISERGTRIT